MEAIKIENISYKYPNGTLALRDVSLSVEEGESIAILGPNGAGKSTLLLLISNILKPEKGSIKLLGEKIRNKEPKELAKKVGILFQDPDDQLFMPTVFDDIAFGPINLGLKKEIVQEKVREALNMVGLAGYEEKCPHHLSFGEKRKVCIAAVLSMNPEILLLDEPTSGLDPLSKSELLKILKRLNKEGKTIVIATHDVRAAVEVAQRIYILNKTIISEGKTKEIFSKSKILQEQNLDLPELVSLFTFLRQLGYWVGGFPLSVNEAAEDILKLITGKQNCPRRV